ncbi:hypothetical protein FUAX_45360 (plasmid) [Fulvitalea axinellae]|uniref:Uncharacterized protein n=1 Tax=Fulvitalea axinellae TaxID=1182444 RepID=A0AAU9CJ06_9BACT|nr:hypothetical protein FUAX_45360 [Fulvitalea axinellae]
MRMAMYISILEFMSFLIKTIRKSDDKLEREFVLNPGSLFFFAVFLVVGFEKIKKEGFPSFLVIIYLIKAKS